MKFLTSTFFVTLLITYGYNQVTPVINSGYSALLGTFKHDYRFQEYHLGAGIQFKSHFTCQLSYSHSKYGLGLIVTKKTPMRNSLLSVGVGYRILKSKFSPAFCLTGGIPIQFNADSSLISSGFLITPKYSEGSWRYNRGLFFGKLKALCDVQLQAFNLQFGVSFNQWYYSRSNLGPDSSSDGYYVKTTGIGGTPNFGLEAGLMYNIPTKRDKKE